MTRFLVPLLLGTVFHKSLAQNTTAEPETCACAEPEACFVQARVRAEDLSPNQISRGELRIQVPYDKCANQIVSVVLRLQLDEFSEVKFLKSGAVLPEILPTNQTAQESAVWTGSDIVYDYQAHDDGLSDPELWTVKAEERHAWMTEATLLDNNPDLTQPIVTPFTVAVPAVNYPPVNYESRQVYGPVSRHSFSVLGYRYIAVVKFADGRTENVLAGHTTFAPVSQAGARPGPYMANTTFEEVEESKCNEDFDPTSQKMAGKRAEGLKRCLPESLRSVFSAEIFLESGNAVHKGRTLKGRVTVHSLKAGSPIMSEISVDLRSRQRNRWAQAQAATGGDSDFSDDSFAACRQSISRRALDIESPRFAFYIDNPDPTQMDLPYIDFEIYIPPDTPVDFASYYTIIESELDIRLTVLHSLEVTHCIDHNLSSPLENIFTRDDAAMMEEDLWDPHTRIGEPIETKSKWSRRIVLQAAVPITVLRAGDAAMPVVHYLTPGLEMPAPVLRSGAETGMPHAFPIAQPVFTVEALVDTAARLMQAGSTDPSQFWQQHMNITWSQDPDPAEDYLGGPFAGLLWKKKIVAEERGILPSGSQVVEGDIRGQQPFSTAT
ncbi:hypothetical protein MSAN_00663100 [Mycena sanguinolenta]|uniref:Uncharacterized protein n=1 Tax=Mycena sanguinolenta TaxID=230812 RepID=A0A8H7DER0_9AGAR|nr:hypothetical protein MSAN_00663100 [Mycena sanguinolenta]